jgi:hypothetical protein
MIESQRKIIYSLIVLLIVLVISYYGYKKFISKPTPEAKVIKKNNSKENNSKENKSKENKKPYIAPKPREDPHEIADDQNSSSEDELDKLIDKVNERR